MKLPPRKPLTIRVDRGIWESVTNFLARLTENPNGESLEYFQGYAGAMLEEIAEKQPSASPAPQRSSAAPDKPAMIRP